MKYRGFQIEVCRMQIGEEECLGRRKWPTQAADCSEDTLSKHMGAPEVE